MFEAILGVALFALLIWTRLRHKAIMADARHLKKKLADTQQELEKAEHRTHELLDLLNAFQEHKVAPTGKTSWTDLADFVVHTMSPLSGAETVVLLKWDAAASEYRGEAARGLSPQALLDLHVHPGQGILGRAASTGAPVSVTGSAPGGLAFESFLTPPYVVVPLWVQNRVDGLLTLSHPRPGGLGMDEVRLATLMAKQIELVMENLDLYENRLRTHQELVKTLAQAASTKEQGGPAHTEHCRILVQDLAREMKLPRMLAEQIEFGAMLHDVGKLGIPDALLAKPEALTDQEFAIVKKHPQIGYEMLRGVGFMKAIAPMVLYHHEWVNGQGYPEGLAGEEIPLGARMIAIADAWDAMTTDQPFRKAMTTNNASAELRQQAGTQFDPKLVDVFLRVVSSTRVNA